MCRDNLVFECIIMPLYACNDYYYYFNFVTWGSVDVCISKMQLEY